MPQIKFTKPLILCGDIHGSPGNILEKLEEYDIRDVDIIILGDIGIWRYSDSKGCFALFDKFISERNINCYLMRGNHDNPIFFPQPDVHHYWVDRFWSKFTNLKLLPDYTEIIIGNKKGLAIGGGLSVDRIRRKSFIKNNSVQNRFSFRNDDWWPNEVVKLPEDNIPKHYDFLLTHNGPTPDELNHQTPIIETYSKSDYFLIADINKEQEKYKIIHQLYSPDKWYMGHYHLTTTFMYRNTTCRVLDEFELLEFR